MLRNEDIHYHSDRASRELDMSRSARCDAAARAHLRLSALHFARVAELRHARVLVLIDGINCTADPLREPA